jgi:hypothetical protein
VHDPVPAYAQVDGLVLVSGVFDDAPGVHFPALRTEAVDDRFLEFVVAVAAKHVPSVPDCNGKIWGLQRVAGNWQRQLLLTPGFSISTFGEDEAGNLYVANYAAGQVYEIRAVEVNPGVLLQLLLE